MSLLHHIRHGQPGDDMSPEEALAAALQSLDNGGRDVPDSDALGFAGDLSAALTVEGYTIVRSDELARLREAKEAVLALHPERKTWPLVRGQDGVQADGYCHWCGSCRVAWPCPTRAALEDRP